LIINGLQKESPAKVAVFAKIAGGHKKLGLAGGVRRKLRKMALNLEG
jgi:hypothetical protein